MVVQEDRLPSTMSYRAVAQKNAMYDQYFRNTTNRLQDDLRSTMKTYNSEKERLVHQLTNLQSTDRSYSALSMESGSEFSSSFMEARSRKFFRAPNLAAMSSASSQMSSNSSGKYEGSFPSSDKRWKEKRDADKIKKEREMLKLPVIHSASSRRSEWDSGKGLQEKKPENWSGIDPLPGISAAKELLSQTMKIPSIYDPDRSDTMFDTKKHRKERKKVTFADDIHTSKSESFTKNSNETSKNSEKAGPVPKLNLSANQFSHVSRPVRLRKTSLLPPLEISPSEVRKNPQRITDGVNQWKSLYGNIIDPEERTRALTDILNAVRLKKFENEQQIKYGDTPRPEQKDSILKNFLMMNASERITYRDEHGNKRRGFIPAVKNTDIRLSRRQHNTVLQTYLRKMSRSRCLMNKVESQACSLSSLHEKKTFEETMRQSPIAVQG